MNAVSTIPHIYNNVLILQNGNGYWNASAMCRANGKQWSHYWENASSKEYADELAGCLGIPRDQLTSTISTGPNELRGTWVHQRIALHLAQWCNAKFAVRVTGWVEELLTTGRVQLPQARPQIGAWFARITPAFEDHKRYIVQCCPAGAFSILTATLGDMLLTEDELLRHSLPIKHHDLPDGSIGKQYRIYREDKGWVKDCLLAPLLLPEWRKSDGGDITVNVSVYDADERRYFEEWLHRDYFREHLPGYLERKFPQTKYGLTSASAADNSARRITGQRATLPPNILRMIDSSEGRYIPATAPLGIPPRQRLLFDDMAIE